MLSHPSVESLTWWGLWDRGAWLGAPAGLVRADGTPKPAYDALCRLVKDEWWLAPTTLRTGSAGHVQLDGWFGRYALRLPGGPAAEVDFEPGAHRLTVRVPARGR